MSKPTYDAAEAAGAEFIKQITQPLGETDRRRIIAQAQRGTYPKTDCPHPVNQIDGVEDYGPGARVGRPLNVFVCRACNSHLFLFDPYGRPAADAL